MAHSYYGDKISKNMILTPEGYLVCKDVPIGRIGWMDNYGQELPAGFDEPIGKPCKVYRSPEELFNESTMASFEGKPITNTHPVSNLDINTAPMTERGHVQNIRRDGDFLLGDLHIKDAGLVSEVQNKLKREVSSGYDCSWNKIGDGKYEQREIIGNHVAVVQNGRAGSKVAIHDIKPKIEGSKKMKITKQILTALGLKHFAQDAEPEDIAKAMDAMKEDDDQKPAKDAEPLKETEKKEVKDAEEIPAWAQELIADVKALKSAEKAESKDAQIDPAKTVMDAVEKELDGEIGDEESEEAEKKKKEEEAKENKKSVADSALKKFVQDMKPIIMAIPDEKVRLETAKKFTASVRDSRAVGTSYADIAGVLAGNKKAAMDSLTTQNQTMSEAAETSCNAWKVAGEKMKGAK